MVLRTVCGSTAWRQCDAVACCVGQMWVRAHPSGHTHLEVWGASEGTGLQGWRGWTPCLILESCFRLNFTQACLGCI